jgi:tetratricopeptide (TPR) repeat protein
MRVKRSMGAKSALPRRTPRVRLQRLVAAAVLLAGVAVAANLNYWRRHSRSGSAAAVTAAAGPAAAVETERLRSYLRENPTDVAARFRLSQRYSESAEYPRALAELAILERAQPKNAEVYLRQAMVHKYAGQLTEAEAAARRALQLQPANGPAREWLGEVYLAEGRAHEALDEFQRSLKRTPDSYFALMGKARALEQLFISRFAIAPAQVVAPVEEAVRLDPNNPWGVVTLARMTFNYLMRPEPAEKLAKRAAELDARDAEPYIILAEIALHRPATAENLRQVGVYAYEAAQRAPRDARPPAQLGRALLRQNEPAEAAKLLERSLALGSTPETVYQLSIAYRRAGNAERARYFGGIYEHWNTFMERRKTLLGNVQREPGKADHYYALAKLYLEEHAPDPAQTWLEKAKSLAAADPRYSRMMAQLRQLRASGSPAPPLPLP